MLRTLSGACIQGSRTVSKLSCISYIGHYIGCSVFILEVYVKYLLICSALDRVKIVNDSAVHYIYSPCLNALHRAL